MKKLILASAALCAAATISAQDVVRVEEPSQVEALESAKSAKPYKAEAGRFGVECGISLTDGLSLNGGRINAIYSLSDNLAVRCGFGLNIDKVHAHDNATVESIESDFHADTMNTKFSVLPGIVYSFKGTDRLEPYVGAELVFGFDKERLRNNEEISGSEGYTVTSKTTDSGVFFGANGFTGFNFYLCKDLFIGAELGFGFVTKPERNQDGEYEDSRVKEDNDHESDDDSKHFYHTTSIDLNFRPSIRLGWKF